MSRRAVPITLTERQHDILSRLVRASKTAQDVARRAQIILFAAEGKQNKEIREILSTTHNRVGRWRRRWAKAEEALLAAERLLDKGELSAPQMREVIVGVLSDSPRSGAPPTFSAEQIAAIFALACTPPEEVGVPISHWTSEALAAEAIKREIVPSISGRQVARFLKRSRNQAAPSSLLAEQRRQNDA